MEAWMPRIRSPFGPMKVGAGALTCIECGAEPGKCEHTMEKPFKVLLFGNPKRVYVCENTPLFEIGEVTPKPMRMPSAIGRIMDAHRDIPFTKGVTCEKPKGPMPIVMDGKSPGTHPPYQKTYIRRTRVNAIDPQRARYQPKGSNLCGQTCVATLLDIDIDEAVKLVGKGGGPGA